MRRDAWILVAVMALPAVGAALAGRDLSGLLVYPPPLEVPSGYLRFSWGAVAGVVVGLALVCGPWVRLRFRSAELRRESSRRDASGEEAGVGGAGGWVKGKAGFGPFDRLQPSPRLRLTGRAGVPALRFPWWGWIAVVWVAVWWAAAWCEVPEPALARRYSFFPLWLGFIVVVNGISVARKGSCLMTRSLGTWLMLFGVSAVFWWGFEWLNRFVRNWHYLGAEDYSALGYAAHATLCFSTVLPAVAAVAEALQTSTGWMRRLAVGPAWAWLARPFGRRSLLAGGAVALLATGAIPSAFYPALWVAPLALYLGVTVRAGHPGFRAEVARGDWRQAGTWMAAAVVCGGFWEMWNFFSLPKWIYTVPGVERWHVFEMPLLGYAGYLPFGLECLAVIEAVTASGRSGITKMRG
jgi:hypothetical protein